MYSSPAYRGIARPTGRVDPPSYSSLPPPSRANTQEVDIAREINSFTADIRYLKRLWEQVLRDSNRLPDDAKPDLQTPYDSYLGFIRFAQSNATEIRFSIVLTFIESVVASAQDVTASLEDKRGEAQRFLQNLEKPSDHKWSNEQTAQITAAIKKAARKVEKYLKRTAADDSSPLATHDDDAIGGVREDPGREDLGREDLGREDLEREDLGREDPGHEEAIAAQQQAVRLTPDGHPAKPGHLSDLGISFRRRFERLGDLADIHEAVAATQQAIRLTPEGHPDKPMYLNDLGVALQCRFERLGDISDVDEAIAAQQQAIRLTPDGHSAKPGHLSDLGISFRRRFERLGDLADIHEAVAATQQAIRLTPEGHPDKPIYLNNLGDALKCRSERLGDISDIDDAIAAQQQAILLTPDGHPGKPLYLNNLGVALRSRFERLGDIFDIDEAIAAQQHAIDLTPEGHPDKPEYVSNLELSSRTRFERLGDVGEAVAAQQKTIDLGRDNTRYNDRTARPMGADYVAGGTRQDLQGQRERSGRGSDAHTDINVDGPATPRPSERPMPPPQEHMRTELTTPLIVPSSSQLSDVSNENAEPKLEAVPRFLTSHYIPQWIVPSLNRLLPHGDSSVMAPREPTQEGELPPEDPSIRTAYEPNQEGERPPEHPPASPGNAPQGMTPRDPATLVENIRILAVSFELIAPKLQKIRAVLVSDLANRSVIPWLDFLHSRGAQEDYTLRARAEELSLTSQVYRPILAALTELVSRCA